ncbi:8-amino-7-oxononanoate synthase [Antarcticibacterium sp. 1MA-6-2]|uniref:aminotransferase class I/II-fold pyridoxal phosphate-dependent enzyme n=1 Tax=Antarcticibacterium sp. 1MA-6-2 TaxID=2908210 RepID=UPI001F1CE32E|nr:8-amino-7-oxononanoate synthase [Antarcticibacterium sp. 1MA-6-2]UJH89952.1 8-amino-7-oxononanoate synthase [Antarcticibacterium sp. 1MA-6-2]
MKLPSKLGKRLEKRKKDNSFRRLPGKSQLIDFYSNDYLGLAVSENICRKAAALLEKENLAGNGATGSRLLSGNNKLYNLAEDLIASFHASEAALVFNSGYDANIGFFSAVPQRGDLVLYDELVHASIRDGISMSPAKAYKFRHNDHLHIIELLKRYDSHSEDAAVFIVTESVFSMDGDKARLKDLAQLCKENNCYLIVDEAHATGVFGQNGNGLVQELQLEEIIFARIYTFGKALGCHGAAVLGSRNLKDYLVNFARSFIYTTGLPPHSLATILAVYKELESASNVGKEIARLKTNIEHFKKCTLSNGLNDYFIESHSAIHSCVIPGNERVKFIAKELAAEGFEVKPILSPTVPQGKERLRFCIHSYNSFSEVEQVLTHLAIFIKQ